MPGRAARVGGDPVRQAALGGFGRVLRDRAVGQGLGEPLGAAVVAHPAPAGAQCVLVHRQQSRVAQDRAHVGGHGADVVAGHERCGQQRPQGEVGAGLRERQAGAAHDQHVGVVPVPRARLGRQRRGDVQDVADAHRVSFSDWSQAGSATHHYLDRTAIGAGYRAAPQVFYDTQQRLWYLVYQTGNASYSTNPDISNPAGWSAPRNFYSGVPPIIQQNIGSGFWVDMWVICDSANCYLFSSDDNGHLYRSQTSVSNFPNGMSQPVIAAQDSNRNNLFEASNVYKVQGANQYLLLVEAIGSDGRRYFRSWTSPALNGSWTPLAASESNPFARASNVTFSGTAWTRDISHGEAIRAGTDQTLTLSPCHLQYLYQGLDPNAGGDYNSLPWRLGLLTQTNSTC